MKARSGNGEKLTCNVVVVLGPQQNLQAGWEEVTLKLE